MPRSGLENDNREQQAELSKDALSDRTMFALSHEAYEEFVARLDAPPNPNPRLIRSLRTAAPWKSERRRFVLLANLE